MIAFLMLILALMSRGKSGKHEPVEVPASRVERLTAFRSWCDAGGLTREQADFLAFVAVGESGLNPLAGLGIPSLFPEGAQPNEHASPQLMQNEAHAAASAYDRLSYLQGCPWPRSAYAFGSGGLFAMLPAYAVEKYRGTSQECIDPAQAVFSPAYAIAAGYMFARGLTQRSNYLGTWASLRSGWGLPSKMDNLARIESKRSKWEKHLAQVGLPASLLNSKAPAFPARSIVEIAERIAAAEVS